MQGLINLVVQMLGITSYLSENLVLRLSRCSRIRSNYSQLLARLIFAKFSNIIIIESGRSRECS